MTRPKQFVMESTHTWHFFLNQIIKFKAGGQEKWLETVIFDMTWQYIENSEPNLFTFLPSFVRFNIIFGYRKAARPHPSLVFCKTSTKGHIVLLFWNSVLHFLQRGQRFLSPALLRCRFVWKLTLCVHAYTHTPIPWDWAMGSDQPVENTCCIHVQGKIWEETRLENSANLFCSWSRFQLLYST